MTPVFREAVSSYTPNSQLSSYRVNGDVKTTNFTSKESNSSAQVRNVANGLSQTEKAYTILKKELSRNPVQAPNPQELSWSTPSDSVSVLEFQNQILKAQLTSTVQDKCLSETLHSGDIWGRNATKDTSNISDMDIEVDGCQFESFCSTDYHQWSTFDMRKQNSSEQKVIEDTVQYHGTNLLEWFQKSSAAIQVDKNDVDDFIPFDPPIVSKFGPISRVARSRLKNSDPVIVTADKEISKMTPVTAVTPMQRPYPVSAPAPSRYKVPGQKINSKPDPSPVQIAVSEPHTLWHQHVSHPFKDSHHLHKELNRLEQNATGARTHDERLAYELKAIELKISMQTGKRPDPVDQPDIERIKPPPFNVSSVYITQNQ